MNRDGGYINMLLAEAENERMHLMSFLAVEKPSVSMRAMVLAAQGVFFNAFFLGYLINPKICHRFTAVLEEEAVVTYTRAIEGETMSSVQFWMTNIDVIQKFKMAMCQDGPTRRFLKLHVAIGNYQSQQPCSISAMLFAQTKVTTGLPTTRYQNLTSISTSTRFLYRNQTL